MSPTATYRRRAALGKVRVYRGREATADRPALPVLPASIPTLHAKRAYWCGQAKRHDRAGKPELAKRAMAKAMELARQIADLRAGGKESP